MSREGERKGRGGVVTWRTAGSAHLWPSSCCPPPLRRASMIWIIGEYAERIDNAGELLGTFLENFADETTSVQLQLLTAIVKLFLKRPAETQELVQSVLSLATQVRVHMSMHVLCVCATPSFMSLPGQ